MVSIGSLIETTVMRVIVVVILVTIGIALGPTLAAAVADVNATSMAAVFLGDIVVTLADFIMFFYYLALILGAMGGVWAAVKFAD